MMRILVFSDTHLTHKFDQKKYQYLHSIIARADRVIINGDFWDSWFCTFDQFLTSKWSKLFKLLKEKNTFYVLGNHDSLNMIDDRAKLFCKGFGKMCQINLGNKELEIIHGYELLINKRGMLESKFRELLLSQESLMIVIFLRKLMNLLEKIGYLVIPGIMKKSSFAKKSNELMKEAVLSRKNQKWLIGADTHYAEIDNQNHYANSGCIMYGYASYLLIENGEIKLFEERY